MLSFKKEKPVFLRSYFNQIKTEDELDRAAVERAIDEEFSRMRISTKPTSSDYTDIIANSLCARLWEECGRNVYAFNVDLCVELFSHISTDDFEDTLKLISTPGIQCPYPAFMVEFIDNGVPMEGIIHISDYIINYAMHSPDNNSMHKSRHIAGYINCADVGKWSLVSGTDIDDSNSEDIILLIKLIYLALYVCSENSDVQKIPMKKAPKVKGQQNKSSKPVQRYSVGSRIGPKLGAARRQYVASASTSGKGNKKRPHMRRGHFHTVRYKDANKVWQRKLMFFHWTTVNGGDTETNVIHNATK